MPMLKGICIPTLGSLLFASPSSVVFTAAGLNNLPHMLSNRAPRSVRAVEILLLMTRLSAYTRRPCSLLIAN